jgi:hypothetical protein
MELKTVLYKCNCCGVIKDSVFFQKPHKTCRQCRNKRQQERRRANPEKTKRLDKQSKLNQKKNNYFYYWAHHKKGYCKRKSIPYDLDGAYLESIWTGVCPVYGIEIHKGLAGDVKKDNTVAELDRIDPEKGYVKGNVAWISRMANRRKQDSTKEDLLKLLAYMERALGKE